MTEKLYHQDAYLARFEAKLTALVEQAVTLDRTAFYPGGGGQPCDLGVLQVAGRPLLVTSVQAKSGEIWQIDAATGKLTLSGAVSPEQAALLFVVLTYLGFLLPWAIQPRLMFIYHYLPSLSFLMLALAYVVHRSWERAWSRIGAVVFLAAVAVTFVYFYPHLAAVGVSDRLGESYFWFDSWR